MNVWDKYTDPTDILDFCEGYKSFISASKTEREAVKSIRKLAEAAGFRDMQAIYQAGGRLAAGDKVYIVKNSKTVSLFVVGRKSPVDGLRLICSHLDSPRLDIRPVPVYEREDLAF
jgi:Aspartyl aminopeptidase